MSHLHRARAILWLVTGDSKAGVLQRLITADRTIPVEHVRQNDATILADRAAGATFAFAMVN